MAKDLADYPDIVINETKRELTAERESLLRAQARIDAELESLPHFDPAEVEAALIELGKPLGMLNIGPFSWHLMSWECTASMTESQAHILRETLLKLNTRIRVENRLLFLTGCLPLRGFDHLNEAKMVFRAKQTAS